MSRRDRSSADLVAMFRSVCEDAGRRASGLFVIEGEVLVCRAIEDGQPIEAVLYCPGFAEQESGRAALTAAQARGIPLRKVTASVMGRAVPGPRLPTAAALVRWLRPTLSELLANKPTIVVLVDGVANPDNLGLLLRTAEGAGADGVVLLEGTADPFSRRAVRGARGAVGRLPIAFAEALPAISQLRSQKYQVVAASAQADALFTQIQLQFPLALVVGSEGQGVRPEVRAAADVLARLPMYGRQSSHNVAVATGVLLHEVHRQLWVSQASHPEG